MRDAREIWFKQMMKTARVDMNADTKSEILSAIKIAQAEALVEGRRKGLAEAFGAIQSAADKDSELREAVNILRALIVQ